ncbi:MAG: hypothetical protein AAFU73_07645 [Planctomycetota bacterium]
MHAATVDPEGRLQLPAALRDEVNVRAPEFGFVVTLDGSGSLCLRVRERFEEWAAALRARAGQGQGDRGTLLTVAAHTAPVRCDKQGRVRVPDPLLALIGVTREDRARREVVLVGAFDELHLWSPAGWEEWSSGARGRLASGLDALGGPSDGSRAIPGA